MSKYDHIEFVKKIKHIANKIGTTPGALLAVMHFETGGTFSPSIQNPMSRATGLIQFIRPTAESLGTSLNELKGMTREEQLYYVELYFDQFRNIFRRIQPVNVRDLYMSVLWPVAIDKDEQYILFRNPSTAFIQNRGLDINSDGNITKKEATKKVFNIYIRYYATEKDEDIFKMVPNLKLYELPVEKPVEQKTPHLKPVNKIPPLVPSENKKDVNNQLDINNKK